MQNSNLDRMGHFVLEDQEFFRRIVYQVRDPAAELCIRSPVGDVLLRAQVGDTVIAKAPMGDVVVKVLDVA